MNENLELIPGMLAVESPQRSTARIIEMLKDGKASQVRELARKRAERISENIDRELDEAAQR